MNTKISLLSRSALGIVIALSAGAAAEAKTHHHHAKIEAKQDAEAAEIQALKDQVAALTARIDSTDAARQQAQATADAAQAQAQAAQTTAQAAQAEADAQIKTIPTEVTTAVAAATPKPKTGWWDNTTIGGRAFMDVSNIDQKQDGAKLTGSPNGTNYDIKRMYISIDHTFNSVFSADFTTDFTYDGVTSAAGLTGAPATTGVQPGSSTSATQLYIKKAYLQAKLSDAFVVRLGSADLPWVPFAEDAYGYRWVENTLIDRTKFGTSADWGAHVLGAVPLGELKISYALSAINGAGYKKPGFIAGVDRSQDMDFEGRVSANYWNFVAGVGGYSGKLGNAVQGVTTYHTAQRFDALIAYVDPRIRIGGEYFEASDWNDVKQANPALTNKSDGYSAFASYKFLPMFSLFGRYDWVEPKETTSPGFKDHYYNVGLDWSPVKIVDLGLVYKHEAVDNASGAVQLFSTQNGSIGGLHQGTYDEFGLFTQLRW